MKYKFLSTLKTIYGKSPAVVKKVIDDYRFKRQLKESFATFLSKEERDDKRLLKQLKKDIVHCHSAYLTTPSEYFLFGFRGITTNEGREAFLSDQVRNKVLLELMGQDIFTNELRNKFAFYKLTANYFKRNVFLFSGNGKTSYDDFQRFVLKNNNLFLKRNSSSKGRGIIAKRISDEKEAHELYNYLVKDGDDWIIEQTIQQSAEMAEWNTSSVNTVRLPAILNEDKFTVVGPVFRTGRKGSIVDNAAAGGLIACIDAKAGVINSDGVDERGNYYECHPNSNIRFRGWHIPQWQELLSLAEQIQRTIPHHKYVGWDFALTDKGWVLIEGNWGQFLSQYNDHIGLKKQFLDALNYNNKQI